MDATARLLSGRVVARGSRPRAPSGVAFDSVAVQANACESRRRTRTIEADRHRPSTAAVAARGVDGCARAHASVRSECAGAHGADALQRT
ncbi:MAG: hypothetical protein BGO98_10955 [Myxococcales bacterium 68-20]|nr:MAG: hypothetical protein BGO98_10955 [Myxococcales bacterium 68-20]